MYTFYLCTITHPHYQHSEELIETLEENQVQLQNMMTSKYIGFFLEEISTWQKRLSMVDQGMCTVLSLTI